jgi:metallo-beta-lactamase class B
MKPSMKARLVCTLFLLFVALFALQPCHAMPVDWTTPLAPFQISSNLYYVGSRDQSLDHFSPAHVDRTLHDNDTVTLGGTTITAHKTAGHTRGCTTWTMQTKDGNRTLNVVIVGGWGPNPGTRLVASHGKPTAYPGIGADYDRTFKTLAALPCDIFLGAHGVYFDLLGKLARLPKEGSAVWIDPQGYHRALAEHEASYRKEVALQLAAK